MLSYSNRYLPNKQHHSNDNHKIKFNLHLQRYQKRCDRNHIKFTRIRSRKLLKGPHDLERTTANIWCSNKFQRINKS